MVGILIFNGDRPDIALDNGALYGGLHCGDCFQYYDGTVTWEDHLSSCVLGSVEGLHTPARG